MDAPSAIRLPDLQLLLGSPPDEVVPIVTYSYRATWKVRVRDAWFVVKADLREGFQLRESQAQLHAGRFGVPVADVVGVAEHPTPCLAMRWVEGGALNPRRSAEAWREAGRALRLAHASPPLRDRAGRWGDVVLGWLSDGAAYLVDRAGLTATEAKNTLRRADEFRDVLNRRPLEWLHGDCQPDHFILGASDRVAAILDWADAGGGDAAMDVAVLTMREDDLVKHVLDGYGASRDFRAHVAWTLPLYRALRGAGVVRWLDEHGYKPEPWSIEAVRSLGR